jgi:hypothetical protein
MRFRISWITIRRKSREELGLGPNSMTHEIYHFTIGVHYGRMLRTVHETS